MCILRPTKFLGLLDHQDLSGLALLLNSLNLQMDHLLDLDKTGEGSRTSMFLIHPTRMIPRVTHWLSKDAARLHLCHASLAHVRSSK